MPQIVQKIAKATSESGFGQPDITFPPIVADKLTTALQSCCIDPISYYQSTLLRVHFLHLPRKYHFLPSVSGLLNHDILLRFQFPPFLKLVMGNEL